MERVFIYLLSGFLAAVTIFLLIQGLPSESLPEDPKALLNNADQFYKSGETAKTLDERKKAFNQALGVYSDLEQKYHPDFGNGKLYYNIANTYFQLDDLPLSIYYYNRALALAPRDPAVRRNLAQAMHNLKLAVAPPTPLSWKALASTSFLSLPERLNLFFWSILILFVLASLYIWRRSRWLKPLIGIAAAASLVMLCSLFYSQYIAPQEAVLIKPSILYRDAGFQYAKVIPEPLQAGLKVEVVSVRESGVWLKILSPDGSLGYVPGEAIKLL
ncbi:MAG: hypothetical protein LLG04_05640 [Parachlamydia sp.]|nr:hypothetical protein [Parachlamydia sp.]